jgi:hypothetical protein
VSDRFQRGRAAFERAGRSRDSSPEDPLTFPAPRSGPVFLRLHPQGLPVPKVTEPSLPTSGVSQASPEPMRSQRTSYWGTEYCLLRRAGGDSHSLEVLARVLAEHGCANQARSYPARGRR